jgi:putative oxidoreductase
MRAAELCGIFSLQFRPDTDNIIHFLKNVAMTGGLLQVVGFGAGAVSIDNRR